MPEITKWDPAVELKRRTKAEPARDRYGNFLGWTSGGGQNWFSTASMVPWPGRMYSSWISMVDTNTAAGLPAVAVCIRILAETTGMVPMQVYRGTEPGDREKARETWQWYRFHDKPNEDQSAFDFFQDIETSIETMGNAYIWKAKARPVPQDEEDIQLFVMDGTRVMVKRENGKKVYEVRGSGGQTQTYDSTQICHIRGWTTRAGDDQALSPIALHAQTIGTGLARENFEGTFFTNNAQTSLAIVVPEIITNEQAREIADTFVEQHTGSNAWRPAVVMGGGDVKPLQITQQDAQFIEQKYFSLDDACRIFRISAVGMVREPARGRTTDTGQDFERFLKVDLAPRLRRIELGLLGDVDLFPRDSELFPEFLTDAVLKPDIQSRYAAYKDAIQGGWLEANEIRERENLPSHPDGAGLQKTPVGGAPNPPNAPTEPVKEPGDG